MKIALVCPGIGECQRGFERYFSGLYETLKDEIDVTLFKGGGAASEREIVPWFIKRNGRFSQAVPIHKLFRDKTPYHTEGLTYGLSLLRHLAREDYDVVHTIDPPLAKAAYWLRGKTGGRYRLLHSIGCYMPHEFYPRAEHIHHVGRVAYEQALEYGFPEDYLSLIPVGFNAGEFVARSNRKDLRRKYGIPEEAFVILSVAAVNRKQKRIDHLIEEVARLKGDYFLLVDGSTEVGGDVDLSLIDFARERLGERCRFMHVPTEDVPDLYSLADVKLLASLDEAFGIVLIEAAMAGVPVLAHNGPHFKWLLQNDDCLVDMTLHGALTSKLQELMDDERHMERARPQCVRERFDWASLKDTYIELYRRVAAIER